MNSRIFTLTTLFLFFVIKINAQTEPVPTSGFPISNELKFTLLVEDIANEQEFKLITDDIYYVLPHNTLFFNIDLNYLSEVNIVTFYRLRCHFNFPNLGTPPPDPSFFGITNPVIIPPIRKKKGEIIDPQSTNQPYRPLGFYPYRLEAEYTIRPTTYSVTVELLKYDNFQDYINNAPNFTLGPTATFILNAQNSLNPAMGRNATDTFSVLTFPNPSTNYVTFEYTGEATKNVVSQQLPLGVTIFNSKGVQVSQHSLTGTSKKTNSLSYTLDTSHLQKGTYYFQLSHGSKTQVKTIIKE